MTFRVPARTIEFLVRGKDGPDEMLSAEYSPMELAVMRRLVQEVDAAEPGSPERQDAMNSVFTIHEMKALLDAEIIDEFEFESDVPEVVDGVVTLSGKQQREAERAGRARFARRRKQGSQHRWNRDQREHTVEDEINDIGAEIAVGVLIGVEWKDSDRPDYEGDLGPGVQVRATHHPSGRLVLHPEDKDDHVFFLAIGSFPSFSSPGWLLAKDGKTEDRWGSLRKGRPAFLVEQSDLHKVEEWIDIEHARSA